jgi:hypothetical protein
MSTISHVAKLYMHTRFDKFRYDSTYSNGTVIVMRLNAQY